MGWRFICLAVHFIIDGLYLIAGRGRLAWAARGVGDSAGAACGGGPARRGRTAPCSSSWAPAAPAFGFRRAPPGRPRPPSPRRPWLQRLLVLVAMEGGLLGLFLGAGCRWKSLCCPSLKAALRGLQRLTRFAFFFGGPGDGRRAGKLLWGLYFVVRYIDRHIAFARGVALWCNIDAFEIHLLKTSTSAR